jgi:hypothetical protein
MEMYEVDLRSRKTGNSVECIYSGDDYEEAYEIAENWNKENVVDYDDRNWEDYIDGTDGMFAEVYHIDELADIHGVGKFVY